MVYFLGSFIYSFKSSLGALLGRGSSLGVGDVLLNEMSFLPSRGCPVVRKGPPFLSHLAALTHEVKFCYSGFLPKSFFWRLCTHENTNVSSVSQGNTSITLFSALVSLDCIFYR